MKPNSILLLLGVAILSPGWPSSAREISVTTLEDAGPGSLREAIGMAGSFDRISFDPSLDRATITLAGSPLAIDQSLSIDASELPGGLTVDAVGQSRVFEIGTVVEVALRKLTITGGRSAGFSRDGGGIYNLGSLRLDDCALIANVADLGGPGDPFPTSGGNGGGIYNVGTLSINGGQLSGNTSGGSGAGPQGAIGPPGSGGGLYNLGTASLSSCTISENLTMGGAGSYRGGDGAGIFNAGELSVYACLLAGNVTGSSRSNAFSANSCGGYGAGIFNSGSATLTDSTLMGNRTGDGGPGGGPPPGPGCGGNGGGIHNEGTLFAIQSTITGNTTGAGGDSLGAGGSAGDGAGISNSGTLKIVSSTISNNQTGMGGTATTDGLQRPPGSGGGLANTLRQVSGFDLLGSVSIENSIVAGNHGSSPNDDDIWNPVGTLTFAGNNLIGGAPLLAPVGDYGGPTPTMPPRPGSPAIDAGQATSHTSLYFDQRGPIFRRTVGAALDLGAYETGTPAGFAAWAAETIPAGLDAGFSADPDRDAISNGQRYGGLTSPPMVKRSPSGGAEFTFGYREEAGIDLAWSVARSVDLAAFVEILRITGGEASVAPGITLSDAPGEIHLIDESVSSPNVFYRLKVEKVPTTLAE